jgi:S1-C subfamily serine protease
MKLAVLVTMVTLGSFAAPAAAQTTDERAAARELVAKRGDAIVRVMGTLKARMSAGGRDNEMPDQAVEASATVIDGTGLTVLAMSSIEPGNIIGKNPQFIAKKLTMTTELVDLKLRLADGKEVPATIVLRDSDLDLLFVKPASAPASPMPAIDSAAGPLAAMDSVVIVQRFGEVTGWKTASALGTVEVVIDKPRRFYQVAVVTTGNAIGAAVFDTKGQFAGIVTLRATDEAKGNALTGLSGDGLRALGMIPSVLPASDIREVAKQVK